MKKTALILLLFALLMLDGCGLSRGKDVLASADVISSKAELIKKVEQGLSVGQTEISFETKEIGKEDLEYLNKEHDGFYGCVTGYKIRTVELLKRSYITLYCEIYDNYYVERAILKGEPIPEDRKDAARLLQACRKLLPEIGGKKTSPYRKEKRIHDYLVKHVEYGYPDGDESEDSPAYSSLGALVEGKAVCNGYAQAMKLLCDLTDVECRMISGKADGENHAWNLVKLGGSWYHVDVTWDDPAPDNPDRILYQYFNEDDSLMALDHSWDEDAYQEALGGDYNYFAINELACDDFDEFTKACMEIFSEESPDHFQVQVKDYSKEAYSESALQFLFPLSGAESLNMQAIGKEPWVTLYFNLAYE